MIRAFHNALDLKLVHDDVGIAFHIGIAGVQNILFVFLVETELLQIVLPIEQRDDKIALVCGLLPFDTFL